MGRKKVRRKPPSRIRYEQEHPTVSARVDRTLYERLTRIREKEGKSFADVIREAVRVQERSTERAYQRGFSDGRAQGRRDGYQQGFAEAKKTYVVRYRCSICDGWLELSGEEGKAVARECLEDGGWGHSIASVTRPGVADSRYGRCRAS